jgi:hypothetical protein
MNWGTQSWCHLRRPHPKVSWARTTPFQEQVALGRHRCTFWTPTHEQGPSPGFIEAFKTKAWRDAVGRDTSPLGRQFPRQFRKRHLVVRGGTRLAQDTIRVGQRRDPITDR